ncbi:DUF2062 domain-containing protein [Desulfopila sp. IMCC35008]|uniref:DUF2062 domain-containing protein n=1 Tax=Desulfopila sp. IMCC35008 TaxID=2653858 RepID=UPI0013D5ACF1|nr:DUF2062 domain-containing protein [Desulfopila sp. IMCC35008]
MNFSRIPRYYYRRFQRLKGDPYALAGGFAIGVFIGVTPTMPLHTVAIILLTLATRTSTIAGILSSWIVCNPLTYLPIYFFSMKIGNVITPYHLSWSKVKSIVAPLITGDSLSTSINAIAGLGFETLAVMLAGGTVLALPFTIASYYFSLYFFISIKKKRIQKRILH